VRIAIISPNYPPERGACSGRISFLAQSLQAAGHQVMVITAMPNYPTGRIFSTYRKKIYLKEYDGAIQVLRTGIYPSNSTSIAPRIVSMVSLSLSVWIAFPALKSFRPDVIFVQSPPLLLAASAQLMSRFSGARFVLNLSDLWPSALADLGAIRKNGLVYKFIDQMARYLYRKASLVVGQSDEIIAHVQKQEPQTPTLLYRTGIIPSDFALLAPPDEEAIPDKVFRLVYTGLLGIVQGVTGICQHIDFASLGAELHIYGDGPELRQLNEWLRQHPDRGVVLHPSVPASEIPAILSRYDAALVSMQKKVWGTVPSKIYEAMAAGLPVLYYGNGEGALMIQEAKAGLVVNPPSYRLLAAKLQMLAALPASERYQMGLKGRSMAYQRFNRQQYAQRLIASIELL
jgi:glycosyltransferase involved in cell wall biosynthesis